MGHNGSHWVTLAHWVTIAAPGSFIAAPGAVTSASAADFQPLESRRRPVSYTHLRAHETGAYL
eukprot:5088309-Pyramimonas_sp.AAC.1